MAKRCLLTVSWLALLAGSSDFTLACPENGTTSFPLLMPPDYNVGSIVRTFVELQNQWCPPRRYKKFYVLNYSPEQQSEEILTAILKLNDPPKFVSDKLSDMTYYTFESRRCAIMMVRGYERLKVVDPIYFGSRYFIFHPKLQHNTLLEDLNSGGSIMLDKAYHIVYSPSSSVDAIYHHNFFSNRTVALDPLDARIPDDLRDLHGRRLRMWLPGGATEVTSFDAYLGETIAHLRNATFDVVPNVTLDTDYGVVFYGVPLLGTSQIMALGSTFMVALVPRSKPKPVISVLIDPFDSYTWIGLLAMIVTMALALAQFGHFLRRLHPVEVGIELVMCILGGPSRTYGGWFENHLITTFCLLSIVLVSSYQSLIISYLSAVRYFPEINSAEEIRNKCTFPYDTVFAGQLDLKISTEHSHKAAIKDDKFCYLFSSRDNSHITSLLLAQPQLNKQASIAAMATQRHNLRIADETFFKFHLLYYFFHKSLVRELFPFFISAFFEAGLFDQYNKNKSIATSPAYQQETFLNHPFTVAELSIVWYLFLAGTTASIGWFLLELLVHHFPTQIAERTADTQADCRLLPPETNTDAKESERGCSGRTGKWQEKKIPVHRRTPTCENNRIKLNFFHTEPDQKRDDDEDDDGGGNGKETTTETAQHRLLRAPKTN
uniref:Ionotropic glutamate receptor C-terminal domain-containing protein n=1 Tax=Anopheles atroparvus TaxID=41427 RepID=A0A182JJN4_ANOAO